MTEQTNSILEPAPEHDDSPVSEAPSEAEIDREEARLDALDATPDNRRRSAIILTIVAVLFVGVMALIVTHPPLSHEKQQSNTAVYRVMTEDVVDGPQTGDALSYAPIESPETYHLWMEHKSQFQHTTSVEIKADVIVDKPLRSVDSGVTIQLADVFAEVYNNGNHVELASTGGMLAGVSLYARFLPQSGLSSVVPDANINPQVARALYSIVDVLHFAWVPLSPYITPDAKWTFVDKADLIENAPYRRSCAVGVKHWDSTKQRAELNVTVGFVAGGANDKGTIDIVIERGKLISADGTIGRDSTNTSSDVKIEHHEVTFSLHRKDVD